MRQKQGSYKNWRTASIIPANGICIRNKRSKKYKDDYLVPYLIYIGDDTPPQPNLWVRNPNLLHLNFQGSYHIK